MRLDSIPTAILPRGFKFRWELRSHTRLLKTRKDPYPLLASAVLQVQAFAVLLKLSIKGIGLFGDVRKPLNCAKLTGPWLKEAAWFINA